MLNRRTSRLKSSQTSFSCKGMCHQTKFLNRRFYVGSGDEMWGCEVMLLNSTWSGARLVKQLCGNSRYR